MIVLNLKITCKDFFLQQASNMLFNATKLILPWSLWGMTRLWNQPQLAIRGTAVFGPGSAVIMDGFLFTSIALFVCFFI